jgi:hypothetical protein
MSDERRYDDAEVAEILERATALEMTPIPGPSVSATGLTLLELQEIGAQAGIPPERIAAAARLLSSRAPSHAPLTFLGAPRSVRRCVSIARALTDDEWTRLVVDLRETFGAEGRVRVHGQLRSWTNGNLQVHVEPEGDRYRVRMETLKGDTFSRAALGVAAMGGSGVMFLVNATGGLRPGGVAVAAIMGLIGLVQLGYTRALLPRWASERAAQMESLAERIGLLVGD